MFTESGVTVKDSSCGAEASATAPVCSKVVASPAASMSAAVRYLIANLVVEQDPLGLPGALLGELRHA